MCMSTLAVQLPLALILHILSCDSAYAPMSSYCKPGEAWVQGSSLSTLTVHISSVTGFLYWLFLQEVTTVFSPQAFNLSFLLSTSQTPVKVTNRWTLKNSSIAGGFGTVSEEGYGVSYIVVGEDMGT